MSGVVVRTRGKRGVQHLSQPLREHPLLDHTIRQFDSIFAVAAQEPRHEARQAPATPAPRQKPANRPVGSVEALLRKLERALAQQAAAPTAANRRTAGARAKRYRKALRLLGVESPPDRSVK